MSAPKLCVCAHARLLAPARGRAPVHALPRLAATHAVRAVRAPATASNDAVLLMHVVVALAPNCRCCAVVALSRYSASYLHCCPGSLLLRCATVAAATLVVVVACCSQRFLLLLMPRVPSLASAMVVQDQGMALSLASGQASLLVRLN